MNIAGLGRPILFSWWDFSENSVGHYAAADMGIMLTKFKSESFPLTIVDCLFAGKPTLPRTLATSGTC